MTYNVLWEVIAGIGCGWFVDRIFGWLTFKMPGDSLAKTGDGLIAIAATFVSCGVSEFITCYGFFVGRPGEAGANFEPVTADFRAVDSKW